MVVYGAGEVGFYHAMVGSYGEGSRGRGVEVTDLMTRLSPGK